MKFAENNRISQRQLYRQIVIAFIAPLILCLFGNRKTLGLGGLGLQQPLQLCCFM